MAATRGAGEATTGLTEVSVRLYRGMLYSTNRWMFQTSRYTEREHPVFSLSSKLKMRHHSLSLITSARRLRVVGALDAVEEPSSVDGVGGVVHKLPVVVPEEVQRIEVHAMNDRMEELVEVEGEG